jgi:hypothetical protein
MKDSDNTINEFVVIEIHRIFHPTKENTFFSGLYEPFTKITGQ